MVKGSRLRPPRPTWHSATEPVNGLFNIGLLHTACGFGTHKNYAPCGVDDLVRKGYDDWALGHVHTRAELLRDPWIVFPGNLQGRHINEAGPRGATLVTVSHGRVASVASHALDVLRWGRLSVDATGAATRDDVLNRAGVLLDSAVLEAEGRLLVVRVMVSGDCTAHAELVGSASPFAARCWPARSSAPAPFRSACRRSASFGRG